MSAVFGPKSLYSLLPIWSLPPLELSVANIIHVASAKKTAMNTQSILSEPRARETLGSGSVLRGGDLMILCLHRGQVSRPIVTAKKQKFPQKSGSDARANASAVK